MKKIPVVAVFAPLEYGYYRDVLSGIGKYAGRKWRIVIMNVFPTRTQLQSLGVDALIGPITSSEREDILFAEGLPCVNVSGVKAEPRMPSVISDNVEIGRIAAQHLIERGYTTLGCLGTSTVNFDSLRRQGFTLEAQQAGIECIILPDNLISAGNSKVSIEFLENLAKPIGVFAFNDRPAAQLVGKTHQAQFQVPTDIAVIGVDNDLAYCTTLQPQLTSVDPAADIVGFEAAKLLDRILAGESINRVPKFIPPRGVVPRGSTDLFQVRDTELEPVIRFIHKHACQGISVKQIAEKFLLTRRTLERKFIKQFNRSILDEVRRVQFEHARELLIQTDLKIPSVAERCGFGDFRNFTKQFQQHSGLPPGKFRSQRRMS